MQNGWKEGACDVSISVRAQPKTAPQEGVTMVVLHLQRRGLFRT